MNARLVVTLVTLCAGLSLAQTPATAATVPTPEPAPPSLRVHVGAQVGLPMIAGVGAITSFLVDGRPRFDADLWWELSGWMQSYSVGAAWHPFDRFFFVGGRLRLLHFHPFWDRAFNGARDTHFGMGLEAGVRLRVGPQDKGLITIALEGTFVPTQGTNLASFVGLTAGFSWAVFQR